MEKLFWFSLPITLLIVYLLIRAAIQKPVSRRDVNMIFAIYLMFYVFITAGLGLFWVARMDLPAFDLHYLFGYCLLILVSIHLWFQLPLVTFWIKKNSPPILIDEATGEWKPIVKNSFLFIIGTIIFSAVTIIVYEFMNPASINIIEAEPDTSAANHRRVMHKGKKISVTNHIHQQGNITRGGAFIPRFNIAKPSLFKSYPNYPTISLPAPSKSAGISLQKALSQKPILSIATLDLQRLSNILYYSYGVTETRKYPGGQLQLRAAASSGALYPNDLYIAAFTIKGLNPGIYYYHPANHSLVKVSEIQFSLLAAANPDPNIFKNAAAAILVTAYFDRSVWKYHDRSYRYVLLDSGHILGNLALASSAMHIPHITTSLFDDKKMEKILGLSTDNEGVLYMVILGKKELSPPSHAQSFKSVALTNADKNLDPTRLSHQLTSVQWVATSPMNKPVKAPILNDDNYLSTDTFIPLTKDTGTSSDLFSVIKSRRSFRQFSQQEINFNDFSEIIQEAYSPIVNVHNVDFDTGVQLFIIASHVQGLPHGVYRFIPAKSSLLKIIEGDFSSDIYHAALSQEVLKRAAFVMAWVIDLTKIGELHGERDYRQANIEGGLGSETAYLATEARKLGTCAVGAFYDNEVQNILHISGTGKRAVLLTAVGQK